MVTKLASLANRILFVGAFALAGLAVLEKLSNVLGFTLAYATTYPASRLLELAAVALLFVIALDLREIKTSESSSLRPGRAPGE